MFVFDTNACTHVSLLSFANLGGFGNKINLFVLKCAAVAPDQESDQGQVWC